jgi:hypothetical protein
LETSEILEDLRSIFGKTRVALTADEVAVALGTTPDGFSKLRRSNGFPLKITKVAGKPTVSIYDFAAWLAGKYQPEPANAQALAKPARKRKDISSALNCLALQMEFLRDLYIEIEKAGLLDSDTDSGKNQNSGAEGL